MTRRVFVFPLTSRGGTKRGDRRRSRTVGGQCPGVYVGFRRAHVVETCDVRSPGDRGSPSWVTIGSSVTVILVETYETFYIHVDN